MTTVADVTAVVTDRCGAYLTRARAITGSATVPGITQAIGWAVRMLGYTTASITTVTDGEVDDVETERLDALLDLAELRTLESVQGNLTAVDVTAGPVQESLGQLAERIGELVTEKRKAVGARYSGWLVAPLSDDAPKRATLRVL